MRKVSNLCDFFIICSGSSDRNIKAISEAIEEGLDRHGIIPWHREGKNQLNWVVLDYGDVVVHIFSPAVREFYDLEYLWSEAKRLPLNKSKKKKDED